MQLQVLLSMGQDQIPEEESRDILYQRVHMVTTSQDLQHSPINFVRLAREYLGTDGTLSQAMITHPHHIDRYERLYHKNFAGNHFFRSNTVGRIHKTVHVFLHSCNMMSLDDSETSAFSEFGEIQRRVDQGESEPPPLTG